MTLTQLLTQYGLDYLLAYFMTLQLTFLSFAGAFITGILVTVMRVCPIKPLRISGEFYIQIFRNIPGAAFLIFLVYALPNLSLVWSYYTCVLIATIIICSAFMSEYLLSGINTIDKGQIEAARSLGLTFNRIITKIVIPQALRSTILQMTNLLIATMLTTALASQVPLDPADLTGLVAHINTYESGGLLSFLISAVFYSATAFIMGYWGNKLDKKVRIKK